MKLAIQQCSPASMDIIHTLPLLHMSVRDQFDDDEFFEEDDDGVFQENIDLNDKSTTTLNMDTPNSDTSSDTKILNANDELGTSNQFSMTKAGRTQAALQSRPQTMDKGIIIKSIQSSIMKLKLTQLKNALKKRGLKSSGSKNALQQRLLLSMLEDIDRM